MSSLPERHHAKKSGVKIRLQFSRCYRRPADASLFSRPLAGRVDNSGGVAPPGGDLWGRCCILLR